MTEEWKTLDRTSSIDIIDSREYIIQEYLDEWVLTQDSSKEVIINILDGSIDYRYKAKPLESIKITKEDKRSLDFALIHMRNAYNNDFLSKEHRRNCMGIAMEGIQKILNRVEVVV